MVAQGYPRYNARMTRVTKLYGTDEAHELITAIPSIFGVELRTPKRVISRKRLHLLGEMFSDLLTG